MAYFVAIGISILFSMLSESVLKQVSMREGRGKFAWAIFSVAAVFAVSILNGIRDYSIGTDVLYYGNSTFEASLISNSFLEYYHFCDVAIGMHEPGYALLNWAVSRFTNSPHAFYLVLGLATNGLAYASAIRFRHYCPVTLSWMTYLLLFYSTSLNLLRQGLSIVMVLFAFGGLLKFGWKRYLIWVLLAFSVHQSAAVAIFLLPFYMLLTEGGAARDGSRSKRALLVTVAFVVCAAAIPMVVEMIGGIGLLPEKYVQYLEPSASDRDMTNSILIRLPFVLLVLWLLIARRGDLDPMHFCLAAFVLSEFVLLPLQTVSDAAFRISLYFGIFKTVAYPSILYRLRFPRWASLPVFLSYILFIFIYQVVYSGNGEVYPFLIAPDIF